MKAGEWNELFMLFNKDAWEWWFNFHSIEVFENFCKEVNNKEWDTFFGGVGVYSTVNFIDAWSDEMWQVAKDTLNEDTYNWIYDAYNNYGLDSFLWDLTEDDWKNMKTNWTDRQWYDFFNKFENTDWYALWDLIDMGDNWGEFFLYMIEGSYNTWMSNFNSADWKQFESHFDLDDFKIFCKDVN